MRFHVIWLASAERALAWYFNDADDKRPVTHAANQIDRVLRHSPQDVGESRGGNLRIMFEKPLAVTYRVIEADQMVKVTHVWRY